MSRSRSKAAAQSAGPSGFAVANIKALGSSLATALGRQLEMKHLRAYEFRTSRGESMRIANAVPLYRDESQQYPVLEIKPAEAAAGAYLEVALDYEFAAGACGLTHVSLKVHTGPSPLASALRFRAEWDPRAEARLHAQPHWNIDHVGGGDGAGAYAQETGSAAPWVPVPKSAPWAQAQDSTPESTVLDLRKVHFAMGSSWHLPVTGEDHRHSAPFADEAALVRWVSGCAAYIRVQLAHA